MARRKRASMREGPLANLFRSTTEPEDPPEAPAPPPRREEREERDDQTRVMREEPPAPEQPAPEQRRPEPQTAGPPSREAIFDVEEDEPADVRAYRSDETEAPGRKERLSRIFAEEPEPSGAL